MDYTKDDFTFMARKRLNAFQRIAERLGQKHPITKMMGQRAWGRHDFEPGVGSGLKHAIIEMASLDGAFNVLNTWARDNDPEAQRIMLAEYPHTYEHRKAAGSASK